MRRRVLSVTSTDVMWRSLMWWDQCPAECVLCHCGIQRLVSLKKYTVKEARLPMANKAKRFCKWKYNQVFAVYTCTSSILGHFAFLFVCNGTLMISSHEFHSSVHLIKICLGSIWERDWSAASWNAALLGTNADSGRPMHYSLMHAALQIWRSLPALPPCSESTAVDFAGSVSH